MKVLLAGIVGGILIFASGAVGHMLTGLGQAGLATVPADKEEAVWGPMRSAMTERRVYFFPGVDLNDPKAMEAEPFKTKYATGPTAVVFFNPGPGCMPNPRTLGGELAFNVIEGLIAAFIVANLAASVSYGKRVLIVALVGLSASVSIDGSYWNWYRFPTDYFTAQLVMSVGSSLIAGLAIAKLAR